MNEKKQKEELLFALKNRDKSTLVCIAVPSISKRIEIRNFLKENLKEYKFHSVDLTSSRVQSLHDFLNNKLPNEVKRSNAVEFIVEVMGIENSLYERNNGILKYTELINELNFERELLFKNVPYITLLWCNKSFFNILQKDAPDLWSWITYRFDFVTRDTVLKKQYKNLRAIIPDIDSEYTFIHEDGLIPKRKERIREYLNLLKHFNLDRDDYFRSVIDKLNLLIPLGIEYIQIPDHIKAMKFLKQALELSKRWELFTKQVQCLFYIGRVYQNISNYKSALKYYLEAKEIAEKHNLISFYGAIYHNVGMIHLAQENFDIALEYYLNVLKWQDETKNNVSQPEYVYVDIAQIYIVKENWQDAFSYLVEGTEISKKNKNSHASGLLQLLFGYLYYDMAIYDMSYLELNFFIKNYEHQFTKEEISSAKFLSAVCLQKQEKWQDAIDTFSGIISNYPEQNKNALIFYHTAYCQEQIGDIEQAQKNYKRAYQRIDTKINSQEEIKEIKDAYNRYYPIEDNFS